MPERFTVVFFLLLLCICSSTALLKMSFRNDVQRWSSKTSRGLHHASEHKTRQRQYKKLPLKNYIFTLLDTTILSPIMGNQKVA
ncbi:hypothetical protein L596_026667 [Steinernema carpocapsae]|uniref:Uncharacterized protein n=1 Tax=Steinernema carpocapsae TaxID=34508 RepID=A0A4U5M213_STECR|nr:hypothetical protein L596_026667 [Steinernema carpocapsae]